MRLSDSDLIRFADWSGDRNPLHVDLQSARQSSFGKPIAHGILSVIEAMRSVTVQDGHRLLVSGLEVEFRGAVFPNDDYDVESSCDASQCSVNVRKGERTQLVLRTALAAGSASRPAASCPWVAALPHEVGPLRASPAEPIDEDFHRGIELRGIYSTPNPPECYKSARLTPLAVRVLGLCSYLVGMEIPGLKSLFTRLRVQFSGLESDSGALAYRARTTRFDPQFRMLDTELEVASPQGELLATCEIRSYVRFSPVLTDFEYLSSRLDTSRNPLDGKVALVCGGTRGLGADLTAALGLAGCHVYANYHSNANAAEALVRRLAERGVHVDLLPGDAGDGTWCTSALHTILERHGRLDFLVLNACAAPTSLRLGAALDGEIESYVRDNLRLTRQPLKAFLATLDETNGTIATISSSAIEDPPPDWPHYVALKLATEGIIGLVSKEFSNTSHIIVRPPKLRTSWNDTPTHVVGAIAADHVALHIVNHFGSNHPRGEVEMISEFPPLPVINTQTTKNGEPDYKLVISASFTSELMVPGLKFWFKELGIHGEVETAPYGQILQELLNPASAFSANTQGTNVLLLRVCDWLRELPSEQLAAVDKIRGHLESTADEFVRAMRTHRRQASVETLLVLCPSNVRGNLDQQQVVDAIEADLRERLDNLAGLDILDARAWHQRYDVRGDEIDDSLRDEIAHIPFRDGYFHTLSTLVMRHVHHKLSRPRKVVVVDCDNTLWRGVVGEVGPEGVEFDEQHHHLHAVLTDLNQKGVLICLCSKNEEADVWSVFETREELGLDRDHIVASVINWQPKSENIRQLASRLNLGLDSFIFLDDNPIECAEVRTNCPEVLTLQWPTESRQARQLLDHTWEFDVAEATKEDRLRTQSYREEFHRQELKETRLSFRDFIDSLALNVDIAPLTEDDLPRASQLTLRTNQFNFTTRRRQESDLHQLVADPRYVCRTVRVRDRFGDYGLVGLLIAECNEVFWEVDTFLLSCRVLGRGVEHRMAAELGRRASAAGASAVRFCVEPTERNAPARQFLESISPPACQTRSDGALPGCENMGLAPSGRASFPRDSSSCEVPVPIFSQPLQCELSASSLAELKFEPREEATAQPQPAEPAADRAIPTADVENLRLRERQISRTAFELSTAQDLRTAIDGTSHANRTGGTNCTPSLTAAEVDAQVYQVFSTALGQSVSTIKKVDQLDSLGCDSFKIVEITVALVEKFPWLPSTLLFEHRCISDIVRHVSDLSSSAAGSAPAATDTVSAVKTTSRPPGSPGTDIAVVGIDVRCAGANSADQLWELLSSGRSAVVPVPPDRKHFLGRLHDQRTHWAGLLDDMDRFDAEFFGVSPREAQFFDPQLRLFLEVAWGALEDAGVTGCEHSPDTGVYVGVMYGDYVFRANLAASAMESTYRCWEGFSLANRLSQLLGFRGPSFAVNTACSSSGTALHLACKALNAGECSTSVVGGINLIMDPDRLVQLGRLGILSTTGKCQPFGAEADGTVLGEGVGVVVLRRLDEAQQRGDRIYGVIKGTALSTGSGTVGFTAPNPQAQADAIRRAVRAARVDPRTISYVETHGTGTDLGDPIEVRGLTLAHTDQQLWDPKISGAHRCKIASIKPNIGHLEAGAGILGLIKVLLQFDRGYIAPSLTSEGLNPQIDFEDLPYEVQRSLETWERPVMDVDGVSTTFPRRAGLSSFGVGGANAHIILEEAPRIAVDETPAERPCHVLTLSARNEDSLGEQVSRIKDFLQAHQDISLENVCHTASVGRKHFEHRMALVATSRDQVLRSLDQFANGDQPSGCYQGTVRQTDSPPKLAFLFTGQGSQYAGMAKELYTSQQSFKQALDRCAEILDPHLERALLEVVFADAGNADAELLHQTGYTQPALFAIEYALSELWRSWGVQPDLVIGHSVGEFAAMVTAGGMSLEDGAKLIAARGRLMQALPEGGVMCSIRADETQAREAIVGYEDRVSIAALNGRRQTVISGEGAAVAEIAERLENEGVKTTALTVSHAFHSPLMDPMLAEYEAVARGIRFSQPRIPFVSCVTGTLVSHEVASADYWVRQVRSPVRFTDAMAALEEQEVTAFLEIGPQPVLTGMGRLCLAGEDKVWLPSLRKDGSDWQTLLGSVARLHVHGRPIDWKGFTATDGHRLVGLPTYPFRRKRFWIDVAEHETSVALPTERPLQEHLYEVVWQKQPRAKNGKPGPAASNWIVMTDQGGFGRALVDNLGKHGANCVAVSPGNRFSREEDGTYRVDPRKTTDFVELLKDVVSHGDPIDGIVQLWGLDAPATEDLTFDEFANTRHIALSGTLHLLHALAEVNPPVKPKLWLVTRGAVAAEKEDKVSIVQSPLWGFGRVAALERADIWGGLVDLSADNDLASQAEMLATELLTPDGEDQLALRHSDRLVPRLRSYDGALTATTSISPDGIYLITGGLGGLGLHVARWLVSKGARHLVLVNRRGTATPGSAEAVGGLQQQGATVEVMSADVACEDDIKRVLAGFDTSKLRGVIHAAGIDAIVPIENMTDDDLDKMLAPKVEGAWLLHKLTRDLSLDLFVCFSSISSVWGSAGRAHYAAANAFLDALAHDRRRQGLPALSINWGPWKGSGMASEQQLAQLELLGNHALEPSRAVRALDALVGAGTVQATVADMDWPRFRSIYEARRPRPLLSELNGNVDGAVQCKEASPAVGKPTWLNQLRQTPVDERRDVLTALLHKEVADTLGFDDPAEVCLDQNFFEMGMDSLMAVDFANRLSKRVNVGGATLALDYPTVVTLAEHLMGEVNVTAPEERKPACGQVTSDQVRAASPVSQSPFNRASVVFYNDEDEHDLYEFQRIAYPHRRQDWIVPRWRWMVVESARRLNVRPVAWLYRDSGTVVAQMGTIPVKFKTGTEDERIASWFVDTMVLDPYRDQAVGTRMLAQAKRDVPFNLSLGQTQQVRDILIPLGWRQVAALQTVVLLLRPRRVLAKKLDPVMREIASAGLSAAGHLKRLRHRAEQLDVREIDQFGDRHDRLWDSIKDEYHCAVVRDASYLNWKYVTQPGQDFIRLELSRDGTAVGIVVLAISEPNTVYPYRRAHIVDLVVSPSDRALLYGVFAVVRQSCRKRGVDSVVFHVINQQLEAAATDFGFLRREPTRFLLVCPGDQADQINEAVLNPENWLVTMGDSDIDRPW